MLIFILFMRSYDDLQWHGSFLHVHRVDNTELRASVQQEECSFSFWSEWGEECFAGCPKMWCRILGISAFWWARFKGIRASSYARLWFTCWDWWSPPLPDLSRLWPGSQWLKNTEYPDSPPKSGSPPDPKAWTALGLSSSHTRQLLAHKHEG